jgi:hypothetical protein
VREAGRYNKELGGACRCWLRLCHGLLPYIYIAVREYHDTELQVTRGLYLECHSAPASDQFDEYFFGPRLRGTQSRMSGGNSMGVARRTKNFQFSATGRFFAVSVAPSTPLFFEGLV